MESQWAQVMTTIGAMVALLFGFARWFMDWAEKRDAAQEVHFTSRIYAHQLEFEKMHERMNTQQKEINDTREKMLSEYMRNTEAQLLRTENKEDFKSVHERLGAISRELNHLIGTTSGRSSRRE